MMKHEPPLSFLDWLGIRDAPNWSVARPLGPLFSVVVAMLFLSAIVAAFAVIAHTVTNAFGRSASGPSLGAGAMIAALLGAPFVIWATVLKQKTVEFQKEGHITDRINKAVEMLGADKVIHEQLKNSAGKKVFGKQEDGEPDFSKPTMVERSIPNIEVRIGGLLSLERIAQDSTAYDRGRDHVRVMEIICAYVRENAKAENAPSNNPRDLWVTALEEAEEELAPRDLSEKERAFQAAQLAHKKCGVNPTDPELCEQVRSWVDRLPAPRIDIQLALTILGRRDAEQKKAEARWGTEAASEANWVFSDPTPAFHASKSEEHPNISATYDFTEKVERWQKDLRAFAGYKLDLRGSNLQKADLSDLDFSGARLAGCRMEGADLRRTKLLAAELWESRLEYVSASGVCLDAAQLRLAKLEGAKLHGATLTGAIATDSDLTLANLKNASAMCANFIRVKFDRSNFTGARFYCSDLRQACLSPVGSVIRIAFMGVAFREMSLESSALHSAILDVAFGDATVAVSEEKRPSKWPDWPLPVAGRQAFKTEWDRWRRDPGRYSPPPKPN